MAAFSSTAFAVTAFSVAAFSFASATPSSGATVTPNTVASMAQLFQKTAIGVESRSPSAPNTSAFDRYYATRPTLHDERVALASRHAAARDDAELAEMAGLIPHILRLVSA